MFTIISSFFLRSVEIEKEKSWIVHQGFLFCPTFLIKQQILTPRFSKKEKEDSKLYFFWRRQLSEGVLSSFIVGGRGVHSCNRPLSFTIKADVKHVVWNYGIHQPAQRQPLTASVIVPSAAYLSRYSPQIHFYQQRAQVWFMQQWK